MHLYTHIPFCASKCAYCGFYSIPARPETLGAYPGWLFREYGALLRRYPACAVQPETWYLGGGTPSLLGREGFLRLAELFSGAFDLSRLREWSVEMNPSSVTPELLETLRGIGVNRISLGVQSFDSGVLARIGRRHTVEEVHRALGLILEAGFDDTGIDLIVGLPAESDLSWRRTLEETLSYPLTHLSVYTLSIEPKTRLALEVGKGVWRPRDDDFLLDRIARTEAVLASAGYVRYEISNYARPGFGCRHNLGVWRGEEYLGLGPSAASRIGLERWTRARDLRGYIKALSEGRLPPDLSRDTLSPEEDRSERALFRLRLREGIPGREVRPEWRKQFESLEKLGIAERTGDGWRLTARGWEVCDAVLERLV